MRLFIDLDQHAAIQDFSVAVPAPPPQFKSQDTIDFLIYFIQAGVVQDMGAGFALKFGIIKTGDTSNTILAYQTASTYLTDSNGNPYYQMQVVMNTSQMATAIGTNPSIACTIELRYQDSLNEIIHTLNLAATVFQTILAETGVTPPNVSTGYPDASTIELLVHKNAASGYAGLDSTSHLNGAVIPIDGQTIALNGSNQLSSAAILAYTAANFTTPTSGATVSVTFGSTANLKASSYVRIPIAGYYIVNSITDATHAVLQNNGDPANASSGVTITSGAVVLPAQAAAGGGSAGQNAYTTLAAGFTVPAVGANVTIQVASTAWMGTGGYGVYISGAGYYLIQSISDATHALATNSGSAANSPPGTSVPSGVTVTTAGPMGPAGAQGASLSAYDALTAAFTQPAMGGTVTATISNTAWIGVNQVLYIAGGGYFQVSSIPNATNLVLTNLGYSGNAAPGATVASGSKVSPGGIQGAAGAGGAGLNAYTTLTSNFTQPASGSTVTIAVGATAWMAIGQGIYVTGGGYYTISSIGDATHVTVTNLNSPGNPPSGSTITGSGTQIVSPAGVPGLAGGDSYTTTSASFTQPAINANVTVSFVRTAWMAQNQYIFINGGGYYQVVAIGSLTSATVQNVGSGGNLAAGSSVPSNAAVSPAGPIGIPGPQGPAGSGGGSGGGTPIHAQVNRTSTWPFSAGTAISWQAVVSDSSGMWASGNPTRLTVATTGFYQVSAQIEFTLGAASGSNPGLRLALAVSGANKALSDLSTGTFGSNVSAGTQIIDINAILYATAGQYFEVIPYVIGTAASPSNVTFSNSFFQADSIAGGGGIGEAPTDGQIYGRQSSAWTVVTGGGGGPVYPSARIFDFDDFDGYIQTVSNPNGKLGWTCKTSGAAGSLASGSNQGANSTDKVSGAWVFTGSGTSDWASISLGDYTAASGAKPIIVPGLGILQLEFRMNIGALPTGSQDLYITFGLCNNATSISMASPSDVIWFNYWFGNAITNWQARTAAGGTATNNTTGVAGTAGSGQWHKFQILTNSGWTSIQFKIDGTVVATNTTNIPTNNLCPFFRVGNIGATSWASAVYVDYYYHDYQYTR